MKEFDINLAKSGKPVCTRDGNPVKIVCFDVEGDTPIVALIDNGGFKYEARLYHANGTLFEDGSSDLDLKMAAEKKTMWTNIYKLSSKGRITNGMYLTKEEALKSVKISNPNYITTVKVEWEE